MTDAELIVLTDGEREKFGAYCLQQGGFSDGMADLMEKKMPSQIWQVMAKKERAEAVAFAVVAGRLLASESVSLRGGG